MGMPGPVSKSSYDSYKDEKLKADSPAGNPDPSKFRIDRHEEMGDYLILLVVYPDCKNYEGRKVMVFKDLTWKLARTFRSIDPHFSNNKDFKSPIARFEPTIIGWAHAKMFCQMLNDL